MTPRILIYSIAMGAHYSFYVKSIATFALTFFGFIISVLPSVKHQLMIIDDLPSQAVNNPRVVSTSGGHTVFL